MVNPFPFDGRFFQLFFRENKKDSEKEKINQEQQKKNGKQTNEETEASTSLLKDKIVVCLYERHCSVVFGLFFRLFISFFSFFDHNFLL